MSIATKIVKCAKCQAEMEIKSFRLNPGKHVIGTGYICQACLDKEKNPKETPKK